MLFVFSEAVDSKLVNQEVFRSGYSYTFPVSEFSMMDIVTTCWS